MPLHSNLTYNSSEMEFFPNSTISNSTEAEHSWTDGLKPMADYLMVGILIVVMLSMGCAITWKDIWLHIRRPIALIVGVLLQFILKPLCAFLLLKVAHVKGLLATGVLIVSCCPGGVLSNTFTYFVEGDLGLSISMTTVSSVIAMGLLPGNLWLYGRSLETEHLVMPYKEMALSLLTIISPVILGMVIKWKSHKIAKWVTKIGSYTGVLLMFTLIGMKLMIFPHMFDGVPWIVYALVVFLPTSGLILGYFAAYVVRQNDSIRKAIAIECGMQNVPIALTVIAISFPNEMQQHIVLLPWLYGLVMLLNCSMMCLVYHGLKKRREILARRHGRKEITLAENGDVEEREDLMATNGVKVVLQPLRKTTTNNV